MCRHLAYLGPRTTLADLVLDPPHGLHRQAWAPRHQRHGTMNVDGFGVGWYPPDHPGPVRYRRAVPLWTDRSFAEVARVTRTGAALASVRSASAATAPDESAAAPFRHDRWLFSHNGAVPGWTRDLDPLLARLPPRRLLGLEAHVDSALVWALVLDRLEHSAPADALAGVVADVRAATSPARLNLLLTDGEQVVATAAGDSLFWRRDERGTVVASEPGDDGSGWVEVPEDSLVTATRDGVEVVALAGAGR